MTLLQRLLPFLLVTALHAAEPLTLRDWTVDGVKREALIQIAAQAKTVNSPLVFVFHGHGGTMRQAARSFHLGDFWPEAIVVYMQGLNTPGRLTDPEGKRPGWQSEIGDQGDRDLKFFDAVLASLKDEYRVDAKQIYSTGHSNGGGFTYLLWAARGDVFAAMAPSSAVAPKVMPLLKPKPVMHIAGETDPLVKYEWQQMTMKTLRRLNECGPGTAWEQDKNCTSYPSALGNPVVTAIHPGGHQFLANTPELIVKFFKEHRKR